MPLSVWPAAYDAPPVKNPGDQVPSSLDNLQSSMGVALEQGLGLWPQAGWISPAAALTAVELATDTGTANAYAITQTPAPTAYFAGLGVLFKAVNANSGPSTLNVAGLGTKALVKNGGTALAVGDILAGQIIHACFDGVAFQLLSGTGVVATVTNQTCQGRLTLTSGTAVTTADVVGASTVYFTPYRGNRIALYNGTIWTILIFTEVSLALSGLTSGKNYDVFGYNNNNVPALELSAAWTNDTTRADALALQDGVPVKASNTTRRWLGIIRATGATTTEDSALNRFVCNGSANGKVKKPLRATTPGNASYSTSATSWSQVDAYQVNYLTDGDVGVSLLGHCVLYSSASGTSALLAIGSDAATQAANSTVGQVGTLVPSVASVSCADNNPAGYYPRFLLFSSSTAGTSVTAMVLVTLLQRQPATYLVGSVWV